MQGMDQDASKSQPDEDIHLDGLPWHVALSLPAEPCKLALTFYFHHAADTALRVQTRTMSLDFEQAISEAGQKVIRTKLQFTTQVQNYSCQGSQTFANGQCALGRQKRQKI